MIERIAVDPEVHFGKPCVAGTRITVQNVLELLDEDLSFDEIIADYYPGLTPEDIRACIHYAIGACGGRRHTLDGSSGMRLLLDPIPFK